MDATQRPIIFPPEFECYAEKHNIFQTFQLYLEHLILKRPEDPLQFLHNLLTSSIVNANKIIVLGPPTKERRELCKTLCGILKTVHITLELLENSEKLDANEYKKRKKHKLKYIRGGKILKISSIHHSSKEKHLPFYKAHKKAKIAIENLNQEQMHEIKTESRIRFEEEKSEENQEQLEFSAKAGGELISYKTESDITNKIIEVQYEEEEESVKETELQEEIKTELQEEEKMITVSQKEESKTELQEEETNEAEQNEVTNETEFMEDKTYQTELQEENIIEMELQDEEIIRDIEVTKDILEEENIRTEETNNIMVKEERKIQELEIKRGSDLDKEKAHEEENAEMLETESQEHWEKAEIVTKDFESKSYSSEKSSETSGILTNEHKISKPFYNDEKEEITFRERPKLVVELMKQIETQTCKEQGWLIEGFPTTRLEGRALQQWAVFPNHVVILNYPSDYNFDNNITNVKEWLLYKNEISGLLDCYKHYYCRHFTLDQPFQTLTDKILKFITNQPIFNTPFTPRVLLLGLPGSGKTTQGILLSERYNIINVDISELIFQTINQETPIGESIKYYVQNNLPITDCLKAEAIAHRVSKKDALSCGYVLHSFPITVEQMEELNKVMKYRMPNRVIVIDISESTAYNRLKNYRTNNINYKQQLSKSLIEDVHLSQKVVNEQDSVKNQINTYLRNIGKIEKFFQDYVIHIDGEMDVENVSEAILSAIIHPLSKKYEIQSSSSQVFNMERLCKGLDCNLIL